MKKFLALAMLLCVFAVGCSGSQEGGTPPAPAAPAAPPADAPAAPADAAK